MRVGKACCMNDMPGGEELNCSVSGCEEATVARAKMTMQRAEPMLESGPLSQNEMYTA